MCLIVKEQTVHNSLTHRHQEAGCFAEKATTVAKYFLLSNTKPFHMEIRQMHSPGLTQTLWSLVQQNGVRQRSQLWKVTWCFTPQPCRVFANLFSNTASVCATVRVCMFVCDTLLCTPLCWVMLARPCGVHVWECWSQLGMRGSGPVSFLFTRRALSTEAVLHPQSYAFLRRSQLFHLLHSFQLQPKQSCWLDWNIVWNKVCQCALVMY